MKYRDYSLNYVPRSTKRPTARPISKPATPVTADRPLIDEPFIHRHSNVSEPLIDVNDTESRLQKIKDNFGTAAHAGAHLTTTHLVPRAKKHAKTISTHVQTKTSRHVPKLTACAKKIKPSQLKTYRKLLVVLAIFFAGYYFATHQNFGFLSQNNNSSTNSPNQPVGGIAPDYDTLLPKDTSIGELGGWQRVSPPDSNPVFAYIDTIDQTQISVSQQPLPNNFSTNPDKEVKELALGFNASNRRVADDATVYFIGTSTKGPQSVILAKDKILILMKSTAQIKDASWGYYIASLE